MKMKLLNSLLRKSIQSEQQIARFTPPMITKHDQFLVRYYSVLLVKK